MWATVEQVIENKIYVIFDDNTKSVIINSDNLVIKENNYIQIVDNKIVDIKEYNEELYKKIKALESKVLKKKNN